MTSRAGRRADAAREASREAGLLAPGLVHELRQPLTGIDAGLKLIARTLGDTVTDLEAWSLVVSQVARLDETLRTYHDLMDDSRGEQARAFAVEPLVRRAVDLLRFRLRRVGERFSLAVEEGVPAAHGSPGALLHAMTNVLVNAVDAIEEAGGSGRVEVRIRRAGAASPHAQVRVADDGVGVADAVRARLFEPRFTTKPPERGSGLGLTIARSMMRNSGGEVRLVEPDDPDRRAWARTEFAIDLASPDGEAPRGRRVAATALRVGAALGALTFLLAAGWALFHRWMTPSADPARPGAAVSAANVSPTVITLDGRLERRTGPDAWTEVAAGERLAPDDVIRTGERSRASLAIGSSRLTVNERTQLAVREITAAVQRFKLSRGHVLGDWAADGARVLVVEDERGDAVARTEGARFSILSTGAALAVETQTGVVRLESGGAAVHVGAGQRSVAFPGARPAAVTPIPMNVLLRVAAAAAPRGQALCAVIHGKVDAGSEVTVDGAPIPIAQDGTFEARVPRASGKTRARVVTRDVAGRRAERIVPCSAAPGAEVKDFAVRWHDGR